MSEALTAHRRIDTGPGLTLLARASVAVFVALLMLTGKAAAQDTPPTPSWDFEARIYGWLPDLSSTTITGQDVDIDLGDILDTLNFTFQGGLTARRGPWSLSGDLIYLSLSEDAFTTVNLGNPNVGPGIPVEPDIDFDAWIVTAHVGYDVVATPTYRFTPLVGARYIDLDVDVTLSTPLGSRRASVGGANWDGIVGFQGRSEINDRWAFNYYADIGTGDSDLTWQVAAVFDYRFNERWTGSFGYRHLDYEFDDPVAALTETTVSGPILGVRYNF